MLYLIYGADFERARVKAVETVNSLQKKKPDASFIKVTDEDWNKNKLAELVGGQGLFENKLIVFFDRILKDEETQDTIFENLEGIKSSQNIFIFLEGRLNKPVVEKIKKFAEKIQEFEDKEKDNKSEEFNIFSITDAFGKRDKKNLWVLYEKALEKGKEAEEIHGILFWQVKSMLLAKNSKSAEDAGLKPFPFQKAKGFLKNFKEGEIENISSDLVRIYHESRMKSKNLEIELEKWILSL